MGSRSLLVVPVVLAGVLLTSFSTASGYPRPGALTRVSVSSTGGQAEPPANGGSCTAQEDITPDGRFVAFQSGADNLVPNDTSEGCDVFVFDLKKRMIEIVSVSSTGEGASKGPGINGARSVHPTISSDGRFVAFQSDALNLVSPISTPPATDGNTLEDIFVRDRKTGTTELVSSAYETTAGPRSAAGFSQAPSISLDGRYVAFESSAPDLVDDEAPQSAREIFVRDLKTDKTQLISGRGAGDALRDFLKSPTGLVSRSVQASISGDGRFVKFSSINSLVPEDGNSNADTYVYDMQEKTYDLITVGVDGEASDVAACPDSLTSGGGPRQISADGRFVVFTSYWGEFVPNDGNAAPPCGGFDAFMRDRETNRTERISVTSAGEEIHHGNYGLSISPDGRYVTFTSRAPNLAQEKSPTDIFGLSDPDVFLFDHMTGEQRIVSVRSDGSEATCPGGDSCGAAATGAPVATGGSSVVFHSGAEDLVPDDTNEITDVFVRDLGPSIGASPVREAGAKMALAGSDDFSKSGFVSVWESAERTSKVTGQTDLIGARVALRPTLNDLFVVLDVAKLPVVLPGVPDSALYGVRFVIGGTTYEARAQRTVLGTLMPGGAQFGLFRCPSASTCSHVAHLEGGYGTIGQSVAISIPLERLGLQNNGPIDSITGFTGFGTLETGVLRLLDLIEVQ